MTISPRTVNQMRSNYLSQTQFLLEQALIVFKQEHENHLSRIERELKKLREVEISDKLFRAFVSTMRRSGSRYGLSILDDVEVVEDWDKEDGDLPPQGQRHAFLTILLDEMKSWQVVDELFVPRFLKWTLASITLNRKGELIPYNYGEHPFDEQKEDDDDVLVAVF